MSWPSTLTMRSNGRRQSAAGESASTVVMRFTLLSVSPNFPRVSRARVVVRYGLARLARGVVFLCGSSAPCEPCDQRGAVGAPESPDDCAEYELGASEVLDETSSGRDAGDEGKLPSRGSQSAACGSEDPQRASGRYAPPAAPWIGGDGGGRGGGSAAARSLPHGDGWCSADDGRKAFGYSAELGRFGKGASVCSQHGLKGPRGGLYVAPLSSISPNANVGDERERRSATARIARMEKARACASPERDSLSSVKRRASICARALSSASIELSSEGSVALAALRNSLLKSGKVVRTASGTS